MKAKIFSTGGRGDGQGGKGRGAVEYLLDNVDSDFRHRQVAPKILQGNPDFIKQLIDSSHFQKTYTAGVLSFEEKDISDDAKKKIMDSFEYTMLPGLSKDQYASLWVEHRDKDRLEMHFVLPTVELKSGKRLQPYYDIADRKRKENWQEVINFEYGLSSVEDPIKQQSIATVSKRVPELKRRNIESLTQSIKEKVEAGLLKSRDDVIGQLKKYNLTITRISKDFISIKDSEGGRNKRLRGLIFSDQFTSHAAITTELIDKEKEYRKNLSAEIERRRKELAEQMQKKTEYNLKRYGNKGESIDERATAKVTGIDPRVSGYRKKEEQSVKQKLAESRITAGKTVSTIQGIAQSTLAKSGQKLKQANPQIDSACRAIESYQEVNAKFDRDLWDFARQFSDSRKCQQKLVGKVSSVGNTLDRTRGKQQEIIRSISANAGDSQQKDGGSRPSDGYSGRPVGSSEVPIRRSVSLKDIARFCAEGTSAIAKSGGYSSDQEGSQRVDVSVRWAKLGIEQLKSTVSGNDGHGIRSMIKNCKDELERFKNEINIGDYLRGLNFEQENRKDQDKPQNGTTLIFRKGQDKRIKGSGEKIGVFIGDDGHYVYHDFRSGKSGSIIDYVQAQQAMNLGQVRKHLRPWIGIGQIPPIIQEIKNNPTPKPKKSSFDERKLAVALENCAPVIAGHNHLEKNRLIERDVLLSERFRGRVFEDSYRNAVYPHWLDGKLVALEKKNKGYTGLEEGSKKWSLWRSEYRKDDTRIVICESADKCLAYHQLKGDDRTCYMSVAGNLSNEQYDLISELIKKNPDKAVVLAMDNDPAGLRYITEIKHRNPNAKNIVVDLSTDGAGDWNDLWIDQVQRQVAEQEESTGPRM